MKYFLIAVSFLSLGVVGCGSASNNAAGTNSQNVQQSCPNGYWNQQTNSCVTYPVNNGQIANQPINNSVQPVSPVLPNNMAQQPCPAGQYFNGTTCAVLVAQQGNCLDGQINSQFYGCLEACEDCEHQYRYLDQDGNYNCAPALVRVSDCRSVRTRHNGRIITVRNGCPNDVNGNYGVIAKVKYRKDGSIKKIKFK